MTTFRELGVLPEICDALDRAGITTPFAIQEMTLSVALLGTDLIGQARTGTGKTLAFGIPVMQRSIHLRNPYVDPLNFLQVEMLRRLRSCSGFPTLSTTISDINHVVASDTHSTRQLTQVILHDASLTTKLLQVVNSAIYGQYHGRIRTVSKAVMILGCDEVRNTAMALTMPSATPWVGVISMSVSPTDARPARNSVNDSAPAMQPV